ncbi:MAG: matrixin family metalloprotease [Caldilineaceae bacterium]
MSNLSAAAADNRPLPEAAGEPQVSTDDPPRWTLASLELDVKFNLNTEQIDDVNKPAGDFAMAIRRAMRTWSILAGVDFTLLYSGETAAVTTGYDGENEIVFMHQGQNKPIGRALIWYTSGNVIVEVDMWLNDDYQFSVNGDPALGEIDLESVVLHELGHWGPLDHATNPDAVMYSVLGTMQKKRVLHADDIAAITQLYPCTQPPCIHEAYQGELATPTPRPSPTATATPTLAPTVATPTLIPTEVADDKAYLFIPFVAR